MRQVREGMAVMAVMAVISLVEEYQVSIFFAAGIDKFV